MKKAANPKPPVSKVNAKGSPERGYFFCPKAGQLVLADGSVWSGQVPDWLVDPAIGEVVFSTGMVGYEQSLTDPSFSGQILMFTYPLIGNYGVGPMVVWESNAVQAKGVVVSELSQTYSHVTAELSLAQWLQQQQVPFIAGVDTRALTKHIRSKGAMNGSIQLAGRKKAPSVEIVIPKVSISEPTHYASANKKHLIVVDCGMKASILRALRAFNLRITCVPHDYDFTSLSYDGVFISNGPGDPTDYGPTINNIKKAMKTNKPIFGICLGSQLMALAVGAKTYKLPFGHRGQNQPCREVATGKCIMTSQNHGYAVDANTLPKDWRVSFENLNDGSVEGIAHKTKPFSAVQFHPEANPGPTDPAWLFANFKDQL